MARGKKGRAVNGIVVINKPLGLSSNQVLQRVKHLFHAQKAGHTGALDPLATGVLPICLGEATKFSQLLLESDKAYDTTAKLGEIRSTGDAEGEVVKTSSVPVLSAQDVEAVLAQFRGDIEQIPPMFSALKLDGKPLYELARQGMSLEEVQRVAEKKRRIITIYDLRLLEQRADELELSAHCSKGTYIRTLVEDIGNSIGCGAYVSRLHRTLCGPFKADQMWTLEQLEELAAAGVEALDAVLLPMHSAIPDWPAVELTYSEADKMLHGQPVKTGLADSPSVQLWVVRNEVRQMIGIGRVDEGWIKAQRMLNVDLSALA